MSDYSYDELEAAHKALMSSCNKIKKVRETLSQKTSPPKAQLTLATRNINALTIALALVSEELEKASPGRHIKDPDSQRDSLRLAAFEGAYKELADSMITIPAELAKLKAAGKEKTVRYRELFGQKLMNSQIAALFERHGVSFVADKVSLPRN